MTRFCRQKGLEEVRFQAVFQTGDRGGEFAFRFGEILAQHGDIRQPGMNVCRMVLPFRPLRLLFLKILPAGQGELIVTGGLAKLPFLQK